MTEGSNQIRLIFRIIWYSRPKRRAASEHWDFFVVQPQKDGGSVAGDLLLREYQAIRKIRRIWFEPSSWMPAERGIHLPRLKQLRSGKEEAGFPLSIFVGIGRMDSVPLLRFSKELPNGSGLGFRGIGGADCPPESCDGIISLENHGHAGP